MLLILNWIFHKESTVQCIGVVTYCKNLYYYNAHPGLLKGHSIFPFPGGKTPVSIVKGWKACIHTTTVCLRTPMQSPMQLRCQCCCLQPERLGAAVPLYCDLTEPGNF